MNPLDLFFGTIMLIVFLLLLSAIWLSFEEKIERDKRNK